MVRKSEEDLVFSPKTEEGSVVYAPVIVERSVPDLDDIDSALAGSASSKVQEVKAPKVRKPFRWGKLFATLALVFSMGIFGFGTYVLASKAFGAAKNATGENAGGVISGLFAGLTNQTTPLLGQPEGRTNFLIIGVDGSGYLADSITLMSYFYDTKEFSSVHIPRDMTVSSQYGVTKINEFFSYAEQQGDRNGPKELKELLEEDLAMNIHYWAQFNFYGVKDLIDQVGGIDVQIPNTFTDCDYPADMPGVPAGKCFKFVAGNEHMDGTRALIFSRSRHAYDNVAEGSDFARGKRQSIVMESLLKKMLDDAKNKGSIFDPRKLGTILEVLGDNVHVSLKISELKSFYDTFYKQLGGLDSISFAKTNWDTSSRLFTANFSTPERYIITYYDGKMMGDGLPSKAREEARKEIADPLSAGKNAAAKQASIIVLGNGSEKVSPVFKEVQKLGFTPCSQCYDNGYLNITPSQNEVITFYISDETVRKQSEDLLKKASFKYTIEKVLPTDRVLTSNNQGVDFVVWIE